MKLKDRFNWCEPKFVSKTNPLWPWVILSNIILVTILAIVSATATIIADTTIQGFLAIDQTRADWLSTAYMIMLAASVPLSFTFAEGFGYKKTFFLALCVFTLSTLCTALSTSYTMIILCRLISGAGAGIIFPLSLKLIGDLFPREKISFPLALYVALGFGMGITSGFMIGGYYAQTSFWQGIYYQTVAIGCISLLVTWAFQEETNAKPLLRFDWLGYVSFLLLVSSLLVMLANVKAPWNTEGWRSTFTLTCITTTVLSLICFLIIEKRHPNPLFGLGIFRVTPFTLGSVSIFLVGSMLFGTASLITPYLERVLGYEHIRISYLLVPFGIIFGITGSCSAFLTKIFNPLYVALTGLAIIMVSCFLNHYLTIQSDQFQIGGVLYLRGLGIGLSLGPLTAISLGKVSHEMLPEASAMNTIFRQMGGAFGASILGVIQTMRSAFHELRFGEMINPYSPAYQTVYQELKIGYINAFGYSPALAARQAELSIINNAKAQAFVVSMDDAFFIFGCALAMMILLIISSSLYTKFYKIKQIS